MAETIRMPKLADMGDAFAVEIDVIEELNIGTGVKMRLVESRKTKIKVIQSWQSMSNRWGTMYRYGDISAIWDRWKALAKRIEADKKPKRKKK